MSDLSDYEEEDRYERMVETTLRTVSDGAASGYLGTYGDAVQERIDRSIECADRLSCLEYYSAAVVAAASAIELTIRFLLVRPLVQGAFLSDDWAQVLTHRVTSPRTADDRKLLPSILSQWSLDITDIRLESGELLWATSLPSVWQVRNDVVHQGAEAEAIDAARAIQSCQTLLSRVVGPIADRLGFTLGETGQWSEIREESGRIEDGTYRRRAQSFAARAPFDQK